MRLLQYKLYLMHLMDPQPFWMIKTTLCSYQIKKQTEYTVIRIISLGLSHLLSQFLLNMDATYDFIAIHKLIGLIHILIA
ncbi:hypothetical protein DLJ74_05705 [Gracilibacillus dipsosauri]|uniref:Uncharacterized protein n=1 Tax=Gracilibacillus dipsosauri TaxID=178340 RepID=A0A317L3K1_9BACI|nr:hypothetical protein DLJ74_05705 [Gracilibacillus dipsosauri]